ncbi:MULTISPECIES: Hpt domain-containing protein [Roseovarius]|uniref:Hpt domain-containing protein n=1 Tax=Roseovarius TaxID=74030 RepID=UPI00273F385C|nr:MULTISPECIES: Hpt domain-containing protein [unclassified Roseovarius]
MTAPVRRALPENDATRSKMEQALAVMRRDFCAGLDERICRIETARLAFASASDTALDTLKFEAHRICGVAGSLGLDEVSTRARTLEEHAGWAEGRALSPKDRAELDRRIEDFLDLLEDHLTET